MVPRWLARLTLVAAVAWAGAAARPADAEPGDELSVHVLTFGPGDHPFFKFGHNAIWVQPRAQTGVVFNFGTFEFDSPALIPKFLKGRLVYWLSVSSIEDTIASYQGANRTVAAQELDLTPAERVELFARLRDNARPEKREYLYDYFSDNCSTRVRDVIDAITGGRVRAAGQRPGEMTLRAHALRMTADLPWQIVGMHLGLGASTDAPISAWQESFLPEKLRDLLRAVTIERNGVSRPLVKAERTIFVARRPATPRRPPNLVVPFLLVGTVGGGVLAWLGWAARRRREARVALGVATAALGLILGLLGLVLSLLWIATDHRAAHANANILQLAPWAITLAWFGVAVARGKRTAVRWAHYLAASAAALSLLGILLKGLPGAAQDNWAFAALLFPLWLGMALGLRASADVRRAPGL